MKRNILKLKLELYLFSRIVYNNLYHTSLYTEKYQRHNYGFGFGEIQYTAHIGPFIGYSFPAEERVLVM